MQCTAWPRSETTSNLTLSVALPTPSHSLSLSRSLHPLLLLSSLFPSLHISLFRLLLSPLPPLRSAMVCRGGFVGRRHFLGSNIYKMGTSSAELGSVILFEHLTFEILLDYYSLTAIFSSEVILPTYYYVE